MERREKVAGSPEIGPIVLVERLDDFDRFAAMHAGGGLEIEQISAGRFAGEYRSILGPRIRASVVSFDQVVRLRGRSAPGRIAAYPVLPLNAGGVWHGRRLEPGRLVIHGPDASTDHHSARRCLLMELSAPAEELARSARTLLRCDVGPGPGPWAAITPPPGVVEAVERSTRLMLALAADPALLHTPDGRMVEERCLRRLVEAAFPLAGPTARDLPLGPRAALARKAEELIRARLHEPVGMIELCAELGVGERTLRRACAERWGLGPVAYARSLRLNAARADLKAGPTSVAEAARRWGFHHLGNFAADYRRAFGERPSETSRRVASPLNYRSAGSGAGPAGTAPRSGDPASPG